MRILVVIALLMHCFNYAQCMYIPNVLLESINLNYANIHALRCFYVCTANTLIEHYYITIYSGIFKACKFHENS